MTLTLALLQPDGARRLGDALNDGLRDPKWLKVDAAVAFVKVSGAKHIAAALHTFAAHTGGAVRIAVGIDQQGSSLEGVQLLWQAISSHGGRIFVVRNPIGTATPTFHPKTWLFSGAGGHLLIVGSGNLTEGGLYTNYELGISLEVAAGEQPDLIAPIAGTLSDWTDASRPDVVELTADVLRQLYESGELPSEAALRRAQRAVRAARASVTGLAPIPTSVLFRGRGTPPAPMPVPLPELPPAPVVPKEPQPVPTIRSTATAPRPADVDVPSGTRVLPVHKTLLIVVAPGQKTELYLTKGVLQQDPAFFGAPFTGRTTPKKAGNPGQPQADPQPLASITVHGTGPEPLHHKPSHALKMWVYAIGASANQDFRITLPQEFLRDVPDGSILVMERDPSGAEGLDYALGFYPPGHARYSELRARCVNAIPGGNRSYGWI